MEILEILLRGIAGILFVPFLLCLFFVCPVIPFIIVGVVLLFNAANIFL